MPSYWSTETQNYNTTVGLEFDLMSSGYLTIAPSDGSTDSVEVPFVWWISRPNSSNPGIHWWDELGLPTESSSSEPGLDSLNFINFDLYGGDDEYFLVLPNLEGFNPNPLIEWDGDWLIGNDPTVDNSILEQMFTEDYQLLSTQETEHSEEEAWQTLLSYGVEPIPSVPEPSSVVSTLVLGAVFVGLLVKRTFFSKASDKTA